eukprot:6944399-Alexandrium_andersonii.AAC.1
MLGHTHVLDPRNPPSSIRTRALVSLLLHNCSSLALARALCSLGQHGRSRLRVLLEVFARHVLGGLINDLLQLIVRVAGVCQGLVDAIVILRQLVDVIQQGLLHALAVLDRRLQASTQGHTQASRNKHGYKCISH